MKKSVRSSKSSSAKKAHKKFTLLSPFELGKLHAKLDAKAPQMDVELADWIEGLSVEQILAREILLKDWVEQLRRHLNFKAPSLIQIQDSPRFKWN